MPIAMGIYVVRSISCDILRINVRRSNVPTIIHYIEHKNHSVGLSVHMGNRTPDYQSMPLVTTLLPLVLTVTLYGLLSVLTLWNVSLNASVISEGPII
jgi:hypothetical protein